MPATDASQLHISIVIPIYNEEANITPMAKQITDALMDAHFSFEVIFVNDGSSDTSHEKLKSLAREDRRFKVLELKRNYGQTAALSAGFDYASGQIVVAMDGDLQNDPRDIPLLIGKILEGYDVCSGWRKNRKDNRFLRQLPSWTANQLISFVSGVRLHDLGCTLKAYRSEVLAGIRLYGEMHRFIPIYASWQGAKITEVAVAHHAREKGYSKYGIERVFKVILDLMVIKSFSTLFSKPIYVFGGFGLASIAVSILFFILMLYFKYWGNKSFIETPLPQLVVLCFLVGFISILMGFMAELLMRTYHESQGKKNYAVKKSYNLEKMS